MGKSTSFLADVASAISNGPATATLAASRSATGPIMDYKGMCALILESLQEAYLLLGGDTTYVKGNVKAVTDSGDTANLALINGLIAVMGGTSNPSTQVVTDVNSLFTRVRAGTGVGTATVAAAIAAAGPIQDYVGMVSIIRKKLEDVYNRLYAVVSITDQSTDATNYALLNNILLAFV